MGLWNATSADKTLSPVFVYTRLFFIIFFFTYYKVNVQRFLEVDNILLFYLRFIKK